MLLDCRDLSILRLAGVYRWLPCDNLGKHGFADLREEISLLYNIGLVKTARSEKYISLTTTACDLLTRLGYSADTEGWRAYDTSTALHRRLDVASVMLTCLRAGIDTTQDNVDSLRGQPEFFPAFALRNNGTNLMNAASCVGFGHWGDKAYMLQYVGAASKGMYLDNEIRQLNNLSSVFSEIIRIPKAMIFAGDSYTQIYERVHNSLLPPKRSQRGYTDYAEVYKLSEIPIHLLPCDESGAFQLAVMCEAEYITKIARAAFGQRWKPADHDIADADGSVDGAPIVIGVDMDVRRVLRVIATARNQGRREVMVAALKEQMRDFYLGILPKDKLVTPLGIGEDVLETAFGKRLTLYTPPRDPVLDESGAYIFA